MSIILTLGGILLTNGSKIVPILTLSHAIYKAQHCRARQWFSGLISALAVTTIITALLTTQRERPQTRAASEGLMGLVCVACHAKGLTLPPGLVPRQIINGSWAGRASDGVGHVCWIIGFSYAEGCCWCCWGGGGGGCGGGGGGICGSREGKATTTGILGVVTAVAPTAEQTEVAVTVVVVDGNDDDDDDDGDDDDNV